MPEELRLQLPHIREVVQVLGAIKIEELEVEADDLLASLAVREANRGKSVAIASSDKDFAQIISGRITLWYPPTSYGNSAKWIPVDSAAAKEKFGVEPPSMVDYLCLVGDAADNIRGVAGIGVKTAAKWLQAYGSIEEIGRHLSELPPRLAKNFSESAALLERNRRLIRFDLSLPIQEIFDCTIDRERLLEFLRQFEFNGLLRKAMGRRGTRKQVQMTLGSQ
jgi:DNA polymerase-1